MCEVGSVCVCVLVIQQMIPAMGPMSPGVPHAMAPGMTAYVQAAGVPQGAAIPAAAAGAGVHCLKSGVRYCLSSIVVTHALVMI